MIANNNIRKSICYIIPIHICFALLLLCIPLIKEIKEQYPLIGLLINVTYQSTLVLLICRILGSFLKESFGSFQNRGFVNNLRAIAFGIAIIIGLVFVWKIIDFSFTRYNYDTVGQNQSALNIYASMFPVVFLVLSALIGPFTEECIYRGILFQLFQKKGSIMAIIGTSVLFSLLHIISNIGSNMHPISLLFLFMNYFVAGLGLALVYKRYKNIWINISIHMLWNTIMSIIIIARFA